MYYEDLRIEQLMQYEEQSFYVNNRTMNEFSLMLPRSPSPHVDVLHAEGLTGIAITDVSFSLSFYPPIRNSRLHMQTGFH